MAVGAAMLLDQDEVEDLARRVRDAPFQEQGWKKVVDAARLASGSWGGQLVGIKPNGAIFVHLAVGGIPDEALAGFEAAGGADPRANPRARVLSRPDLTILRDQDVVSVEHRRRAPFFREFCAQFSADFSLTTKFSAWDGSQLVLAGIRSERQGDADDDEVARFQYLLPHIAASIRLQLSLEEQGAQTVLGAFEALRTPAFLLTGSGTLIGSSPAAEQILRSADLLCVRSGRLQPTHPSCVASFRTAVRLADADEPHRAGSRVMLLGRTGSWRGGEVSPMPAAASGVSLKVRAILTLDAEPLPSRKLAEALSRALGLTGAESAVALMIGRGQGIEEIAAQRGVGPGTVRHQLKRIFEKADVGSQLQLCALVSRLLGGRISQLGDEA